MGMADVLDASEEFSQERQEFAHIPQWAPQKGTSPKAQLESICNTVLKAAAGVQDRLAKAKALKEPDRGMELCRIMLSVFSPALKTHGGFRAGPDGLLQFELAMTSTSEFFADLKGLHAKV